MLGTIFKRKGSEERLVERVKAGDMAAAGMLYQEYVRYLSAICSRYLSNDEDVRDVLQETFLRIFSAISSFHYRGEGSLRGWMSRIALNETLAFMRKNSRLNLCELSDNSLYITDDVATEEIPAEVVYQMIRELPDGYRAVFNLFAIEGKSHKEIAALLGIKADTSASQFYKAKAALAKRLKRYKREKSI